MLLIDLVHGYKQRALWENIWVLGCRVSNPQKIASFFGFRKLVIRL